MSCDALVAVVRSRCIRDSQSFPEAVDEGLEEGLVVGDGLQDVAVRRHVPDGPLAEPRAAQPEDVTVG